jgi:hypothetical protein
MAAQLPPGQTGGGRALSLSVRLYRLLLHAYPVAFRQHYGERMARVFRDTCRAAMQQHGVYSLIPVWLSTSFDLAVSAGTERWQSFTEKEGAMSTYRDARSLGIRSWIAVAATLVAFFVSLVASFNLYVLEDGSSLTPAAYNASPLLRYSYDVVYLSALAAGVAVCAIVGYALIQRRFYLVALLGLVTLMVAIAGFGGLLVRQTTAFFVFFAVFMILTLGGFLMGQWVSTRSVSAVGQKRAAVLGACASAVGILLVNVVALVLHTLTLNPESHALYMQGQIGTTHLNFSLLMMGLSLLALIACAAFLGRALNRRSQQL